MDNLPFDKVLKHEDIKKNGTDYVIVYEYTCLACRHKWRLTMISSMVVCPKCQGIKAIYVSKRSCDDLIDQSEIIMPPENSELL